MLPPHRLMNASINEYPMWSWAHGTMGDGPSADGGGRSLETRTVTPTAASEECTLAKVRIINSRMVNSKCVLLLATVNTYLINMLKYLSEPNALQ